MDAQDRLRLYFLPYPNLELAYIHINRFQTALIFWSVSLSGAVLHLTGYEAVLLLLFTFHRFTFVFVILSCLFLASLWSPLVGGGLTSWLSCM